MNRDLVSDVARYHAALDRRDFDAVSDMLGPDSVYLSPGIGGRLEGRAAILQAFRGYFAEYTDQQAADDDIRLLAPDTVLARWRLSATSRRTGAVSHRRGEERVVFGRDGLIARIEVIDL